MKYNPQDGQTVVDNLVEIGALLDAQRRKMGWSQQELCDVALISVDSWRTVVAGGNYNVLTLRRLLTALDGEMKCELVWE